MPNPLETNITKQKLYACLVRLCCNVSGASRNIRSVIYASYSRNQGCQIFSVAYGQNLNKKCIFLEKLWQKLQNPSIMLVCIMIEDSKCSERSNFLPKKFSSANEASFGPKLTISAINSKMPVKDCLSLS